MGREKVVTVPNPDTQRKQGPTQARPNGPRLLRLPLMVCSRSFNCIFDLLIYVLQAIKTYVLGYKLGSEWKALHRDFRLRLTFEQHLSLLSKRRGRIYCACGDNRPRGMIP